MHFAIDFFWLYLYIITNLFILGTVGKITFLFKGEVSMENNKIPGKGAAVASLVLGIIGVVLWFFGYSSAISVILGIIGLVLAGNSKKAGFVGGVRTAGFVLSLISLIGGAIFFISCVACVGALGAAGAFSGY